MKNNEKYTVGYSVLNPAVVFIFILLGIIGNSVLKGIQGEWFNGKTAAFKVADLGSNP